MQIRRQKLVDLFKAPCQDPDLNTIKTQIGHTHRKISMDI